MLDVLYFPRWVISCKNTYEIEKTSSGDWKTYCPSSHECYGCDGQAMFDHPRNPKGYIKVGSFDIYGVQPQDGLYMSDEYIHEKVKDYLDSEDQFFMERGIVCDVDNVTIYKWELPEDED